MPASADLQKRFIKIVNQLARHRDRYEVLTDFLDMAVCAIRKQTVPEGPAADALEEQYMAVVRRNRPEDVRAMPELLGIAALALQGGGCDFLGQVVHRARTAQQANGAVFYPL